MAEKLTLTWTEIAAALGVSRQSVGRWRRLPGAPSAPDLEAWESFVQEQGLGAFRETPERNELQREKLRREIALLDVKVAQARRQVIDADEVEEIYRTVHAGLKSTLDKWAQKSEIPALRPGADLAEIRASYQEIADNLLDRLASGWKRWLTEPNGSRKQST